MLKVVYDPVNGETMPDSLIEDHVLKLILDAKHNDVTINTGHELTVLTVRGFVSEGRIDSTNVEIWYKGKQVVIDKDGRIPDWPKGFCDYFENGLDRVVFPNRERKPQ